MQSRRFARFGKWTLIPRSRDTVQPDYIPEDAREAYHQACALVEVSPKASAALARSCLQIMIRDFWSLTPQRQGTLASEFDYISPKLPPETQASIDAVRQIGRIDAYLQEDTNLIVDTDQVETCLLITLTEILFLDWYVDRHVRQGRADTLQTAIQELGGDLPMKLTNVATLQKRVVKEDAPAKRTSVAIDKNQNRATLCVLQKPELGQCEALIPVQPSPSPCQD